MNKYTLDGVLALMKLRENSGNEVIAGLGLDIRPAEEEPNGFVGIPQLRKVFGRFAECLPHLQLLLCPRTAPLFLVVTTVMRPVQQRIAR